MPPTPMRPPWVDVPSKSRTKYILFGSGTARSTGTRYETLVREVDRYHDVRKDDVALFGRRITMLKTIQSAGEAAMRKAPSNEAHYPQAVASAAANKAMYLTRLQTFLATDTTGVNDPQTFFQLMERQRVQVAAPPPQAPGGGWARAQVGGGRIGMQGGVSFEKLDPYHRETEIHLGSGASRLENWRGGVSGGLGNYMKGYAVKVFTEGYAQPFVSYLEICDLCDFQNGKEGGVTYIAPVNYGSENKLAEGCTLVTMSNQGHLMEAGNGGQLALFDTNAQRNGGGKGHQFGTKAFIWTSTGDFIVGVHEPGTTHHSTLNGGELVRCAGMIGATDGKVHYVDTNSGHYRPGLGQLHNLIKFLNDRSALTFDAQTFGDGKVMFITDYLAKPPRTFRGGGPTIGAHRK